MVEHNWSDDIDPISSDTIFPPDGCLIKDLNDNQVKENYEYLTINGSSGVISMGKHDWEVNYTALAPA